ncbi:Zn(2)-C6 fungal-type domain-containing protein [Mycena chlorophos]|uniref:Zn(2)-C6 fungal-type domain-containing protein n=1 Tax=Mycena chlorophos TaxID=658473 RepID=A0A8H6TKK9_MYCCL|nr:Zn(2)-C6 fungal-type domain-containing protein [Mycena chlorophos]
MQEAEKQRVAGHWGKLYDVHRGKHPLYIPQARCEATYRAHVVALESRLETAEQKIKQLRAELAAAQKQNDSAPHYAPTLEGSLHMLRTSLQGLIRPPSPLVAEDLEHVQLIDRLGQMHLEVSSDVRFVGKSSGFALVTAAMDLKADVDGRKAQCIPAKDYVAAPPPPQSSVIWKKRRLEYWVEEPWTYTYTRRHPLTFPPMPLMFELVDLFFMNTNLYLPILHRPTFEKGITDGLFLQDDGFAAVLLVVCAVGSRWHPDPMMGAPGGTGLGKDDIYGPALVSPPPGSPSPSVSASPGIGPYTSTLDGGDSAGAEARPTGTSCGWAWFAQVPPDAKHICDQPTLYDLQYYALAVQFLERGASPHLCWNLVGAALRLAQDIGIHRRTLHDESQPTVERELFKRVFWVLLYQDRMMSCGMGRPCMLQHEDFDVQMPIECDDEYWEHPIHPFQQPPGLPCRVTFFNRLTELGNILAASSKLVYSLSKSKKVFLGYGDRWEETVVAELDSAMNTWKDGVPEHLRWDPHRANPIFFDQSAALHCVYYHIEIFIHRPFIPMMRKTPSVLPAWTICTQAGRAIANILELQRKRKGDVPVMFNFNSMFGAAVILLLGIWAMKRSGQTRSTEITRDFEHVRKCMESVKLCESRWRRAGMMWDLLNELIPDADTDAEKPTPAPETAKSTCNQPGLGVGIASGAVSLRVDSTYGFNGKGFFGLTPESVDPYPLPKMPTANRNTSGSSGFDAISQQTPSEMDTGPDAMGLWANAPEGLEWVEDWGQFFHGLNNEFAGVVGQGMDWR